MEIVVVAQNYVEEEQRSNPSGSTVASRLHVSGRALPDSNVRLVDASSGQNLADWDTAITGRISATETTKAQSILAQLPTHENNPRTVRIGGRRNAKVVSLVEANIARPLVRDDVHSGRSGNRSLRGKCFNESGTDPVVAVVLRYIDVQMARV